MRDLCTDCLLLVCKEAPKLKFPAKGIKALLEKMNILPALQRFLMDFILVQRFITIYSRASKSAHFWDKKNQWISQTI